MARYRVEMTRFKCRDETGVDFFGSDEVVFAATSFKNKKKRHSDMTKEFGNVDSGDSRDMGQAVGQCDPRKRDPHCHRVSFLPPSFGFLMKYPEATPARGLKPPFSVAIVGFEIDSGNKKQIKQDVEDIADAIEIAIQMGGGTAEIPSSAKRRIGQILGNDGLGVKYINFGKDDVVLASLDSVGDFNTVNARLTGGDGGDIPLTGGGDYEVKLLVSRVA